MCDDITQAQLAVSLIKDVSLILKRLDEMPIEVLKTLDKETCHEIALKLHNIAVKSSVVMQNTVVGNC